MTPKHADCSAATTQISHVGMAADVGREVAVVAGVSSTSELSSASPDDRSGDGALLVARRGTSGTVGVKALAVGSSSATAWLVGRSTQEHVRSALCMDMAGDFPLLPILAIETFAFS